MHEKSPSQLICGLKLYALRSSSSPKMTQGQLTEKVKQLRLENGASGFDRKAISNYECATTCRTFAANEIATVLGVSVGDLEWFKEKECKEHTSKGKSCTNCPVRTSREQMNGPAGRSGHPLTPDAKTLRESLQSPLSLIAQHRDMIICLDANHAIDELNKALGDLPNAPEDGRKVTNATLIQYSGETWREFIRGLFNRYGAKEVTVWIQDATTAKYIKCDAQIAHLNRAKKEIERRVKSKEELAGRVKGKKLNINHYKQIASFGGIRIDKHILAVGWYIYRSPTPVGLADYPDEMTELEGHCNPMIIVRNSAPDFESLLNFFLKREEELQGE